MKVTSTDIKNNRRMCSEFYSKTVSMKFSHFVSSFCINNKIQPNTVTAMMLYSSFIFAFLLLQDNILLQIVGAFLLFIINIFDTSDGEIARYTTNTSVVGTYYDKLFQILTDILIFTVISYNQYIYFDSIIYTLPLIVYLVFYIIDNYSKEVFAFLKDGNNVNDSKKNKLTISYDKSSKLQLLVHVTSSNTGFFHLYWILLLVDYILNANYIIQFLFIIYFMLLQIVKTIARQYKMIKILKGQK